MNGSTQLLDKRDFRWLEKKANAMFRYLVSPATMMLNLFYAHKGRMIEHYLLFIGYNRTGSSLLGKFLNVHPEIVVSEASILKTFFAGGVGKRGYVIRKILDKKGLSYPYQYVPAKVRDQWEGRYSCLRVIGDKSSQFSTHRLYNQPSAIDFLRNVMGVPLKVLCTLRNPYDTLAAKRLRNLPMAKLMPRYLLDYHPTDGEKHGLAPLPEERYVLDWFLDFSDKLAKVLSMFSEDEVLLVRLEDFISSPTDKLRDTCTFLGVECTEDYLDSCAAVVYP